MTTLYALLVGINEYRLPLRPLAGCRADVDSVAAYLRSRATAPAGWSPLTLVDEQATREAVIAAFRTHLGQARRGDTALFWFSGHGSLTPLPERTHREPSGMSQSLMCIDSRHGSVPDLLDIELSYLIGEVAGTGAHVVVVLDCCHSASGTREDIEPGVRCQPPADRPPDAGALLPSLRGRLTRDAASVTPPNHVALAACRADQRAREIVEPGGHRGVFSLALLAELKERRDPPPTYRELAIGARCHVENRIRIVTQEPTLFPSTSDLIDQPFLGGWLRPSGSTMVMRYVRERWEIDGGSCHGLVTDTDDPARVAVHGSKPLQEARLARVLPDRSLVEPLGGWQPDKQRQYPIVITRLPMPPTTVEMSGDACTIERIEAAMRCAGPDGGPSPHVRTRLGPATELPGLRVSTPVPGMARIHGADDRQLTADVTGVLTEDGADTVVDRLEHIARWQLVKSLSNPLSRLTRAVRIEIVSAVTGERLTPASGTEIPATGATVRLAYRWERDRWVAPTVFIRLRNTTDRPLYCVLLDLTDRYRIHPDLFPGDMVAARHTTTVDHGEPIEVSLPPGRPPRPGATGTDWLKLLVSERSFSSTPYRLPRLGEPAETEPSRSMVLSGVLDRLGLAALYRTRTDSAPALDWATDMVSVITQVPDQAAPG